MKYRSTLFDEARNKIGSAVASKNRNGNYFRNHVIPSNPRSVKQQNVRAIFTNLSQAWRGLTDAQRAGWISLAGQVTLRDTLGNSYHPTGQQLYVGNNTNLNNISLAPIDNAPATPDAAPDLSGLSVVATVETAAPHTHVLRVDVVGGAAGQVLLVSVTPQFSAGRSFVGRSQYRILDGIPLPMTGPLDLASDYEAEHGALIVGSKLSVQVVGITTHGFASVPLREDAIVTAV